MTKIIHFGLIFATNIEANKRPTEMIYINALGAYWNEYGTLNWFGEKRYK